MAELCLVCSIHKPRRECPALSHSICSQCCGRKRRRGIDCPDDCPHFIVGLRHAVVRLARASGSPEFSREWVDVLHNLRWALLWSEVRDLTDGEARAAFEHAASTLRTRSKGLIYDFRSPDPRVQMIVEELLQVADAHEQGLHGLRRAGPAELAACLRHLERTVAAFLQQASGENRFIEVAAQSIGHRMVSDSGALLDQTGPARMERGV
ncbi:hypothetical protein FJY69_04395, partial [candidate division WOR-3 bacterium]|nr:hypothetical protein [candidate division WOR-3 bacterium]